MKHFKTLQASGEAQLKMVDTVNTALYITESQSALMLPNLKDEIDMSMIIIGNNPAFNEWCLDLFNYMWEHARPGDPEKAKIV
jgi:predicted transcriptional regulator